MSKRTAEHQHGLTRRHMLRLSATAAAMCYGTMPASLLAQNQPPGDSDNPPPPQPPPPPPPPPPTDPANRQPHIGIIGAGLAGLAAAHDLIAQQMQVTLIEGRDRIGGRAYTQTLGNTPIDLGAEWIPNDPRHPILELARKFKLDTTAGDTRAMILYGLDGKRVPPARVSRLTQRFSRVMNQLRQAGRLRVTRDQTDISIAEALGATNLYHDADPQEIAVIDWLIARQITSTAGAMAAEVSLKSFWMDQQDNWFHGGIRRFEQGFGALTQTLARGLDVRLAHVVEKIQYTNTGVRVITNVGPFDFDRVVVTLPVAVLKAGDVVFEPALPDWKTRAIAQLGVGHAQRIALRFEHPFWPGQVEFLGSAAAPSDQFIDWTNLFRRSRVAGLTLWSAADSAQRLESMDQQQREAAVMDRMTQIYGNRATPPMEILSSDWSGDPLSRGAWAYMPTGARPDVIDSLAKPVLRRLFFAGDATEQRYFHTAGAAVLSGVRAAREITHERTMQPG